MFRASPADAVPGITSHRLKTASAVTPIVRRVGSFRADRLKPMTAPLSKSGAHLGRRPRPVALNLTSPASRCNHGVVWATPSSALRAPGAPVAPLRGNRGSRYEAEAAVPVAGESGTAPAASTRRSNDAKVHSARPRRDLLDRHAWGATGRPKAAPVARWLRRRYPSWPRIAPAGHTVVWTLT